MSNNYNNTKQKARPTSTAFQRKFLKPYSCKEEFEKGKREEIGTKHTKALYIKDA